MKVGKVIGNRTDEITFDRNVIKVGKFDGNRIKAT